MVDIVMCLRELLNLYKHHVLFNTHFSSSNELFCCSALARAMAPVEVRPPWFRLQWGNTLELDPHSMFLLLWQGHFITTRRANYNGTYMGFIIRTKIQLIQHSNSHTVSKPMILSTSIPSLMSCSPRRSHSNQYHTDQFATCIIELNTSVFSSSGSLSERQPVQRLQNYHFHFLQGCGKEYSRISAWSKKQINRRVSESDLTQTFAITKSQQSRREYVWQTQLWLV